MLGILSTAVTPFVILIGKAPPTPPSKDFSILLLDYITELYLSAYSGSQPSPSLTSLLRAMAGLQTSADAYMTGRERIDFSIVTLIFGTIVGG